MGPSPDARLGMVRRTQHRFALGMSRAKVWLSSTEFLADGSSMPGDVRRAGISRQVYARLKPRGAAGKTLSLS